ncbi:hypothetical protein FA95DRAFT_1104133 [Auriscalpium vulgare]|uniref:Uncharacterized protein n=1 Tax=Auriscalpium vulgare TaxID=40419 RepID=A0ACB8R4Q6_9AGAM|nr:hypothetical protein FA95DRAFT_1104133 [Auriscalpium vulgare]
MSRTFTSVGGWGGVSAHSGQRVQRRVGWTGPVEQMSSMWLSIVARKLINEACQGAPSSSPGVERLKAAQPTLDQQLLAAIGRAVACNARMCLLALGPSRRRRKSVYVAHELSGGTRRIYALRSRTLRLCYLRFSYMAENARRPFEKDFYRSSATAMAPVITFASRTPAILVPPRGKARFDILV